MLFSDARGGSTWLMEVLSALPGSYTTWEPLHPEKGVIPPHLQLGWRPHVPVGQTDREVLSVFEELNRGRLLNAWTTSASRFAAIATGDLQIIKYVRGNAILPWLARNMEFHIPPILLLRHPVAVALSQIRAWGAPRPFSVPQVRWPEAHASRAELLSRLVSPLARRVGQWCLHNEFALGTPRGERKWVTVHYEELLREPRSEFNALFDALGMQAPAGLDPRIGQSSSTDFSGDLHPDAYRQIYKWQDLVSSRDLDEAQGVLDAFDIRIYHTRHPFPDAGN